MTPVPDRPTGIWVGPYAEMRTQLRGRGAYWEVPAGPLQIDLLSKSKLKPHRGCARLDPGTLRREHGLRPSGTRLLTGRLTPRYETCRSGVDAAGRPRARRRARFVSRCAVGGERFAILRLSTKLDVIKITILTHRNVTNAISSAVTCCFMVPPYLGNRRLPFQAIVRSENSVGVT